MYRKAVFRLAQCILAVACLISTAQAGNYGATDATKDLQAIIAADPSLGEALTDSFEKADFKGITTLNLEASVRSACSMEADKAGCRTSLQAGLNETAGRIGAMGIVFREGGQDDRFQVDEGGLRLEPGEGWPRGRREIDGECRGGGSAALHRGLESSRPCVAGQKSLCRHAWRRVAKRSMWTRAE